MPSFVPRGNPSSVDPALAGRVLLKRLLQENAALLREVSELRTLRQLSDQDPLTGLGNLRHFDARLAEHLRLAERTPGRAGSLAIIDINHFNDINERFGHRVGDRALRWLAKRLVQTLRPTDVCCRTGEDEFMLILVDTDRAAAAAVISRLRAALNRRTSHRWWPLEISVGVASWPADSLEVTALIHQADSALHEDKLRQRTRRAPPRLFLIP